MNAMLWEMVLNVSILALIANLLTKVRMVQMILIERKDNLLWKTMLAAMMGMVCIFSTNTGIHLDNVIVNTRVIGALAAGIIGGPYVGIVAGLIGGVHRYFYNPAGFTTIACSLSTLLAGLIGAVVFPYFQRGRWNLFFIFAITALAEALHMGLILLICRPFELALETVETIALPMILLNSIGMIIFITTIKNVFQERDLESEAKLRLALSVAEQCLPYFRKGILNIQGMKNTIEVIMSATIFSGALIVGRQEILAKKKVDARVNLELTEEYLKIAEQAMNAGSTITISSDDLDSSLSSMLKYYNIIAAPLMQKEQPEGCLIVFVKRKWLHMEADISFVKGLATLFSTQLELSEVDYQKRLRQKAELYALQSQVNPHFLYNSLNTLACICRENPSRALKLLVTMATYYRQTLDSKRYMINLNEEIQQVNNYLLLEKARFEDKLEVTMDIQENLDCLVPTLILQPIVENAVKYGVDEYGYRTICVTARQNSDGTTITVTDKGSGFPLEVLSEINSDSTESKHVGLLNVKNRLKSIYGDDSGLIITTSPSGSKVTLFIAIVQEY